MKVRFGVVVSLLFLQSLFAQDRAPQNDSIRKEDLKADLCFLANDLTDGRAELRRRGARVLACGGAPDRSVFLASYLDRIRIPAAQISPALASVLIRDTGRSLEDLSRASETPKGFTPIRLPDVGVELTQDVIRNVIPDRSIELGPCAGRVESHVAAGRR